MNRHMQKLHAPTRPRFSGLEWWMFGVVCGVIYTTLLQVYL